MSNNNIHNKSNNNNRSYYTNNNKTHTFNQYGVPIPTPEHIQQVLGQVTSVDQLEGKGNVLGKLFETTINSLLQAEIEDHLGYASNQKKGIRRYIINPIDVYSRLSFSYAYNKLNSNSAKDFLIKMQKVFPFITKQTEIQNDNGSEFMKYFDSYGK